MKRLGLALVWFFALAAPAQAALTTVADVTVPGNGAEQTTIPIQSGPTVIRVSGSVSESFESCDSFGTQCKGTRTVVQDALYCFAHSGYSDPTSPEYCSESSPGPSLSNWLHFRIGHNGAKYTLFGLAGQPDDSYRSDHAYRVSFKANFSGNNVYVSGSPGLTDTSSSGGIRVEILQDVEPPEPPTGGECGTSPGRRAFLAKVCDYSGKTAFGVDAAFPAPTRGTAILTRSPAIPDDTATLIGDAHLDGAAAGPVAAVLPIPAKTLTNAQRDDVLLCVTFALGGLQEKTLQKVQAGKNVLLRVLLACVQLVDAGILKDRAAASAGGCRAQIAAVPMPGRHPSGRALRRAERSAKAALRGSCAADSSGSLTFALKARRRGQSVRDLVGARATAGFARTRAPKGADGPSPKLVLNWSRVRR